MSKQVYARKLIEASTDFIVASERLEKALAVWDVRLYGLGGANEIKDTDIDGVVMMSDGTPVTSQVTANDLYAIVLMAAQLKKFLNGNTVVAADHRSTLTKTRSDM